MKLEVGSGPHPKKGYVHCDIRALPDVDIVAVAWETGLKSNSVDEIYSRHMIEHLTFEEGKVTLRHWLDILKSGGMVDINVPDLEKHIEQLKNGEMKHALAGFYGWQRNEHDIHKAGYIYETLFKTLADIGFVNIKRVKDDTSKSHLNLRVNAFKK